MLKKIDIFDNHHLIVLDGEERAIEQMIDILAVSLRHKAHGLGNALWRIQQSVAVGIFPTSTRSCVISPSIGSDWPPHRPPSTAWRGTRKPL